jgi:hypothetical protein
LNPTHTEVEWTGTLAANSPYLPTLVSVQVHGATGALVGSAFASVPIARVHNQATLLGPVSIPVLGAPTGVTCSTLAETGRR